MADNVPVSPGSGVSVASDDVLGVQFQRVKLTMGADSVNDGDVAKGNPLPAKLVSNTATQSNVTSSATAVTLLAANTARLEASVYNDSTSILYLSYGSTASATNFRVKIPPDSYFELPSPQYTGLLSGIWVSANGSARVTEVV